jgi:PPOX class probable F420-dependent enzyme
MCADTESRRERVKGEDRRVKLSENEARARFAAARSAMLATVGSSGRPHLVPITFAVEGELIFTAIDHKPKTTPRLRRLGNIAQNPLVAVLADHYSDDWEELWWVRVDGRATVLAGVDEMRHPIDVLSDRYPQYRARRPDGPVIVISAERWTGWSAAPPGAY